MLNQRRKRKAGKWPAGASEIGVMKAMTSMRVSFKVRKNKNRFNLLKRTNGPLRKAFQHLVKSGEMQ